jgi:hypothetical protein
MTLHICPVCGKPHPVTEARQSVAWGRQLSCSCTCEVERRRRVRKQWVQTCVVRAVDQVH